MRFKLKMPVVLAALITVLSAATLTPIHASSPNIDKFQKYRNNIIQDEIEYANNNLNVSTESQVNLYDRIKQLEKAEIVELNFGEDGLLLSAESSEVGDVSDRFVLETIEFNDDTRIPNEGFIGTQAVIPNPSTPPHGAESGAFHRIQTPASTSLTNSYTGVVADSITLPKYDVAKALDTSPTEAAYLYTGIDPSIAEVGMTTTRQNGLNMAAGWYPFINAKPSHKIENGDDNGQNGKKNYYYDSKRRYDGGAVINSFKVYYKYDESYLSVRYLLGTSLIYQVNFTTTSPQKLSIKRLTTIAMNNVTDKDKKFRVPFETYAVWNNMRFLYNNGTQTKYPSEVNGLKTETWNHGGTLDYIKSGNTESIKIY
ncbi:hypothetical protein [Paenibacillus sp. MSJ-34]|uniref:hypothetical protein n=1 Tax=Paenibacillus sp. MSJ-34 TaxID=2841529 RepID=UPI001C0FB7CD|nr:hypothetical protein [Paenibacillus sp. MSJ-34]MBU5444118.1 hypothetical protein [Paenibacillus sp. MSJ-34]